MASSGDPSSFANTHECVCTKLYWEFTADFDQHVLQCKATLDFNVVKDGLKQVILDTRDLSIQKVELVAPLGSETLTYKLRDKHPAFGSALEIYLPAGDYKSGSVLSLCVTYVTAETASALQWMTKEMTVGKTHPYLFSQCQAIHARSIIPCQDTPSMKICYEAKVRAPKDLVVLMSAVREEETTLDTENPSIRITNFKQSIPIPSYLVALVIGDIKSKRLSHRSCIWTEEAMLEDAAWEFAEIENMIVAAESLVGKYVWGVYDLLVLPPSFPYGGMENPCLSFVTPTLLAKDRSLTNVIAHELAHSWTGNLVTNKNWEHFWLNEGCNVFLERMIIKEIDPHGEKMRHFQSIGGWKTLEDAVKHYEETGQPEFTVLVPKLQDVDPDDSFSSVPYEKGFSLLFYLMKLVGGPEIFEPFMKAYITKFQNSTVNTEEWKAYLFEYFSDKVAEGVFDEVDWDTWFNKPGMPPINLLESYDTTLSAPCTALCERWDQATLETLPSFSPEDIKDFSSSQIVEFLAQMLTKKNLPITHLERMEEVYKLNDRTNCEIKFSWLRMCTRSGWENSYPLTTRFITIQGRMKYVRPLYQELNKVDRDLAVRTFEEHRQFYHPICAQMIAKDLGLE